ncbi:unnamed protein product [Phytomonas sp. Hart1]|nr:unnamed protein product [Phytomonas sp. Hart1]|eukprot:CCW70358.1 unnamed protein product [Phytomonas sp. isolate Hart1]
MAIPLAFGRGRSRFICFYHRSLPSSSRVFITTVCSSCILRTLITSRLSVSFLTNRISKAVEKTVERLTKRVFQDEKFVTESRQKLEKAASMKETLAERLERQRVLGMRCIPNAIRVDKTKQYIYFTWPAEMWTAGKHIATVQPSGLVTSSASAETNLPTTDKWREQGDVREHSTSALAEYLRAYTSSTDGSYANNNVLIYGRRGITIQDVFPVGNYAIRVVFSDGHTGGIFTYEYLYFLTCSENKYGLMRDYIKRLREKRKSRDPPRRMPSRRELPKRNQP